MVVTSTLDGLATITCSKILTPTDTTPPTDAKSTSNADKVNGPLPLMEDCKDALQLMQRIDPFCKHISKWLLNGKAPYHDIDTFIHTQGLLYEHVMD